MITFLSKVKYRISNAIAVVTYEISYNIQKILALIPLYSIIKIQLALPCLGHIFNHKNVRSGSVYDIITKTIAFKFLRSFIHIQALNQSFEVVLGLQVNGKDRICIDL